MTRKRIIQGLAAVLLAGVGTACFRQDQQVVEMSDHLSPAEIGINKFVFKLKAPKGSLVVFRAEEFLDGQWVKRQETFSNTPQQETQQAVLIRYSGSPGVNTGIVMGAPGGGAYPTAHFSGLGQNSTNLSVTLDDTMEGRPVKRHFVYTMVVEKYEDALKRVPELPKDLSYNWGYAARQYTPATAAGDTAR